MRNLSPDTPRTSADTGENLAVEVDYDYGSLRYPKRERHIFEAHSKAEIGVSARTSGEAEVEIRLGGDRGSTVRLKSKTEIVGLGISDDGKTLAIADYQEVRFYTVDPEAQKIVPGKTFAPYNFVDRLLAPIDEFHEPRIITNFALNRDGTKAAVGHQNKWDRISSVRPGYGIVRLIDVARGKQIDEIIVADTPSYLEFSDDGVSLSIDVRERPSVTRAV